MKMCGMDIFRRCTSGRRGGRWRLSGGLATTLLPDPGTPEKRRELCERIGGRWWKDRTEENAQWQDV